MRNNNTVAKILKLRDNRKKELELEVKNASDMVDREKGKLQDLERNYQDMLRVFTDQQADGTMDVNHMSSYYDFFSRISGKIREQKKIHDRRLDDLRLLRNSLVAAHRDKKAMEILKDKADKKDRKARETSEQKDVDFHSISRRVK